MKRINIDTSKFSSTFDGAKKVKLPRIPFSKKWFFRIFGVIVIVFVVLGVLSYFVVARPLLQVAAQAKELKQNTYLIQKGLQDLDFEEIQTGLEDTKQGLEDFKASYENSTKLLRKLPGTEAYYQDSQHLVNVAEKAVELGEIGVKILEPHAGDLGFKTAESAGINNIPAQERIIKLLRLMPQFSKDIDQISSIMIEIDNELSQIDASRYPESLPGFVKYFGMDPSLNVQEQILSMQSISSELAKKAPQFEALFNAMPEFMGLNTPKKYLVIMANNYELRMAGGFNTYVAVVEFKDGIPTLPPGDSLDTYFIDEGERTGSSNLVNRNVPYFLSDYLYIQERGGRLYARDATSTSPDFPTATASLIDGFWRKDRSLTQDISGVIQANNDVAVDLLRVLGPVNTDKFSVKTDQGNYVTIPVTEFSSGNTIKNLEDIAGGRLAETVGRKEIIRYLTESMFEKAFTSEATNLLSLANTLVSSMSKKDIMLNSFDPTVQQAFEGLGYGGKLDATPDDTWDYLHVNRSNFGSGKADWTGEPGFVTQDVEKTVKEVDGKKIGTVKVTVHNPKRPDWYNIDPCCFYNAYMRVYAPLGSKLISVEASDGQDPKGAEYDDDLLKKTYFESFTRQLKETDLTLTYTYELPASVDLNDYKLKLQRQSGSSVDKYVIKNGDQMEEVLLNSDKTVRL